MLRWIKEHKAYVVTGLLLTPIAIHSAYMGRGYFAIGGEYLVLPMMVMLAMTIDEVKTLLKEERYND